MLMGGKWQCLYARIGHELELNGRRHDFYNETKKRFQIKQHRILLYALTLLSVSHQSGDPAAAWSPFSAKYIFFFLFLITGIMI